MNDEVKLQLVVILRGLPGAGKSYWLKQQQKKWQKQGIKYLVCSTDHYFIKDGRYQFEPRLLALNHQRNLKRFCHALQLQIPIVVCDNTNLTRAEVERYRQPARNAGYQVVEQLIGDPRDENCILRCISRNQHQVPAESIRVMAQRFEP